MNTTQTINRLWEVMQDRISQAYKNAASGNSEEGMCLRDYAENQSMHDALSALLGRETANERKHRSYRPSPRGFSAQTAAKLILMTNVDSGSMMEAMPTATRFITLRQTAAEAELIGYLSRHTLSYEWGKSVKSLDYTKLMQAA